jgi:regulator of PEP synthase PpsR (kinase-PPPase family)
LLNIKRKNKTKDTIRLLWSNKNNDTTSNRSYATASDTQELERSKSKFDEENHKPCPIVIISEQTDLIQEKTQKQKGTKDFFGAIKTIMKKIYQMKPARMASKIQELEALK